MEIVIRILATLRALFIPPFAVTFTMIMSVFTLICAFANQRRLMTRGIAWWGRVLCKAVGIRLHVRGLENIPEGGVLYVFNHQSLLDIPIIHAAIGPPRDFRFGSKIELFKIPIFGLAMRRSGALPIARANRT